MKTCTISVKKNAQLTTYYYSGFSGVFIVCSESIIILSYVNLGSNFSVWNTDIQPLDFEDWRIHNVNKINIAHIII